MLTARAFPSVCLSCRLKIPTSAGRIGIEFAARGLLAPTARQYPRLQSFKPHYSMCRTRQFSSAARLSVEVPENTTHGLESTDANQTSCQRTVPEIEESVRRARQAFGDTLPKNYLSQEEYMVYERLYGTPLLTARLEDLKGQEVEQELKVVEREEQDRKLVLFRSRQGEELEELGIYGEYESELDIAKEGVEGKFEELTRQSEADMEEAAEADIQDYHQGIYEKSRPEDYGDVEDSEESEDFMRTHPLTLAGRFETSPSTIYLPKETFVDPVSSLLARTSSKHLSETAHRVFGGTGLPHSTTTARASEGKEQKAIPLDPSQSEMGNIEGDAYMAAVMPGTYATVMSTIVEARRRLGTSWIEGLLRKEGGPLILDAGSGGAGVLAWHEVLHAEWQRMHEASGAGLFRPTPLGRATVLTGSDALRHRASRLLENTTFLPRLPDTLPTGDQVNEQQPRKVYDIIIAPHTLWPLRQEFQRREQVQQLWSRLNPSGGVLILLEKGLPRGFEIIAAARAHLLDKYISSPGSAKLATELDKQPSDSMEDTRFTKKETGMIVAPCTNHLSCPMYETPGVSKGRKDFCYFSQRYIRPPYLQRLLEAKDRNHEDVQFSYIVVQRGRDQRNPEHDILGKGVVQGEEAANAAFEGHEFIHEIAESDAVQEAGPPPLKTDVNPLALPRLILPALKRRGHIILDVCTPAGKLERWTVPRSFSKQAFRDARKARWGDLWALGAKTRIPKNVRLGRPRDEVGKKAGNGKKRKEVVEIGVGADGQAIEEEIRVRSDGRYSKDRKDRKTGRKGRKERPKIFDD
ncbi:hypothetical protein K432DRAFT_332241 [Lepidopterella palustris CBS 459.81]|uniref:37S ribosomal protein Rsm22 n=1 Tax=Lepidopterella palustris CBS 459.81 TaxID=1314670 RepID=A0A8E2E6K9_9PEZI|nr:hypothetical protein K432DRAFT_332241 [Lepidopterella palustris CBS 459.81]